MSVSADALRTQIAYSDWASRRLVEAVSQLSPQELAHDFHTSDRTIIGTLAHVFAGDRVWLARFQDHAVPVFITDADRSLQVLQEDWPALREQWRQWSLQLTDESVQSTLAYSDLKGRHWSQPLWQLVLHVVNHGTHHRGQVAGFMRSMGHVPPVLDLVAYYRELATSRVAQAG